MLTWDAGSRFRTRKEGRINSCTPAHRAAGTTAAAAPPHGARTSNRESRASLSARAHDPAPAADGTAVAHRPATVRGRKGSAAVKPSRAAAAAPVKAA